MSLIRPLTASCLLALLPARPASHAAQLNEFPVVDHGKPCCSIFYDAAAPKSVRLAAEELQRVIRLSTGCVLPVLTEPRPPMICLGQCEAARAAGVSAATMGEESFHIITRDKAVFILGVDTADGGTASRGGFSKGTLLGAYAFLERVAGVRWIMPGALGEIIPSHERLIVPPLDVVEAPSFASRQLELSDPPLVRQWALRNRAGTQPEDAGSLYVDTTHSWNELMPQAVRDAHPEWAAVNPYAEKPNYKFCTRNPAAEAAYSSALAGKLDAKPARFMVSAAPSDGQSFCRCARCMAHITANPHGRESMTANLLDFYNDVAGVVGPSHPGRMLGALVYGACSYPPREVVKLRDNLFVEWAPLDVYGLGLYKPGYRDEFDSILAAWRRITPNLGYSNYLHWHRSRGSAPLAPAPELMKLEFGALKKNGVQSVREAVDPNWAYAGPNNWLLARLMWKADADVDALYREWLDLAYAEGAGAMGRLYALVDDAFREFKQQVEPFHYSAGQYDIDRAKIRKIHVPLLGRMDALCREALASAKDPRARQRIGLFIDNMKFFHHELRRAGYVQGDDPFIFAMSGPEFEKFAAGEEPPGSPPARIFMRRAEPLPPAD